MTVVEKIEILKSLLQFHQYELEFRYYLENNTSYLYSKLLVSLNAEEIANLLQELYDNFLEKNDAGRKSSIF